MERYVDEDTKTYSPFASRNEAAGQYQPRSGQETFDLVTVIVPKAQASVYRADPLHSLLQHYVRRDEVLFAVHPDTWDETDVDHIAELRAFPRGEPIQVAATASTRTVFALPRAEDVPRHFLKLHFPHNISRFNRRLRRKNICNSVAVTRDLADFQFDKFAYLPDVLGFTFGEEDIAWGFLVREAAPRPFRGSAYLIPCFALYGCDLRNPADPPLLVQLIERSGADPESFVTEQIMVPIVECWARVARERGILLESHAQNTLLELDQTSGLHASSTAISTFGSILKSESAQASIHLSGRWESIPAVLLSNITAWCMTILLAASSLRIYLLSLRGITAQMKDQFAAG